MFFWKFRYKYKYKRKSKWKKWLKRISWISFLLFLGLLITLWLVLPELGTVKKKLVFNAYTGQKKAIKRTLVPGSRKFIKSETLPKHVIGAILVSEDSTFYQHNGLDWHEFKIAFKKNIKELRYARGASTITQQVVKNAFLSQKKTILRKVVEMITAYRLEKELSKREILNYYINLIEMGPGIYGIRDGARYYFRKEPKRLTPREAALLSFMIPSPKKYGQAYLAKKPSKYREQRVKQILRNMVLQKYIKPSVFRSYYPGAYIWR